MNVALWGNADRAQLYEDAVAMFLEDRDDTTISLTFAELAPYLERLATTAAANDLPDVFWMRDTHIGWYGSSGSLLDLSPYLDGQIDTTQIGEAAVEDGTVGDGVFALPTHYVGQAVLYNLDALATVGIDSQNIDTWSDLLDAAREARGFSDGAFGISDPTLEPTTHRHLEAWIRQAGEELFSEDGRLGFTSETLEAWFEMWQTLREEGVLPPPGAQIETQSGGLNTSFLSLGRSAMQLNSTNHLTIVQAVTEDQMGLGSVPASPDSTDDWWFFPPILISAAANTEHPEVAAELINFFINDIDAGLHTKLNQGAPSSAAVRDALLPELTDDERAFVEQISREQEYPRRPFPIRPEGNEEVNAIVTRAGQDIAYGVQSVSDAVATLMTDGNAALEGAG